MKLLLLLPEERLLTASPLKVLRESRLLQGSMATGFRPCARQLVLGLTLKGGLPSKLLGRELQSINQHN